MTPQTDLVVVNDAAVAATGAFSGLESTISGWIQYAQNHGENTAGDTGATRAGPPGRPEATG